MPLAKATPEGLTDRAASFVRVHGHWTECVDLEPYRAEWARDGVPDAEIDRVVAYQATWGGLALPPSPSYDGGPRALSADRPYEYHPGWRFWAGDQRTSLPYSFMIGPDGEFGLQGTAWAPLHAGIEGWIEALALAHHARRWARATTTLTGEEVDTLDLDGFEPVPEVAGLTDTWWRRADSLVALYLGEAAAVNAPGWRTATIYTGLDPWGSGDGG
ncbi:hypothetical protein [Streptomyces sp. NPDC048606]|uniref:hypothetical protein n=1 Tax=Streptomyces sp. NPDC048606 TaxID=3154726 RepID=UPI003431D70A